MAVPQKCEKCLLRSDGAHIMDSPFLAAGRDCDTLGREHKFVRDDEAAGPSFMRPTKEGCYQFSVDPSASGHDVFEFIIQGPDGSASTAELFFDFGAPVELFLPARKLVQMNVPLIRTEVRGGIEPGVMSDKHVFGPLTISVTLGKEQRTAVVEATCSAALYAKEKAAAVAAPMSVSSSLSVSPAVSVAAASAAPTGGKEVEAAAEDASEAAAAAVAAGIPVSEFLPAGVAAPSAVSTPAFSPSPAQRKITPVKDPMSIFLGDGNMALLGKYGCRKLGLRWDSVSSIIVFDHCPQFDF